MAKNKIERIDQEIEKTREKIAEYQEKLKTLETQKTEAENLEIVQMVRAELKGAGGDKVLGGQTAGGEPAPLKPERQLLVHVEDTMQLSKPRFSVQRFRRHAQPLEVIENVGLNALQTGLGRLDAVRVNAKGKILGFDQAVVSLCQLVLQHGHVFDADAVKIVPLERDVDGAGKGFLRCCKVQKRQLKLNRAVEVVEEIAPALEDRGFILVL